MFQTLVNRNEDIGRLIDKGLALGFSDNGIVVRDIPYLNEHGELRIGTIFAPYETVDGTAIRMQNHQVDFAGSYPCELSGERIANLGEQSIDQTLSAPHDDVRLLIRFSNKPRRGGQLVDYANHYDKIMNYVMLITAPAMAKYPDATPYTFRIVEEVKADPIFKFGDTLTSRARIGAITRVFANDDVAVIGLGGTGCYLLDFLAKTPVPRIRGFDADEFRVHNAFRSPGQVRQAEFGLSKASVYEARYADFRHGLSTQHAYIDETSDALLDGVTFAFVAVDKGPARKAIFKLLTRLKIAYIDVGMGLRKKDDRLRGSMRVTNYSLEGGDRVRELDLAELGDGVDNLYHTNIQIGELNALNACLAVIRFKQLRGFFAQDIDAYNLVFNLGRTSLVREQWGVGGDQSDDED